MLFEFTNTSGEVKYLDLASNGRFFLKQTINEYNEPFKLTGLTKGAVPTYCLPINDTDWIGMFFNYYHTKGYKKQPKRQATCTLASFWVKANPAARYPTHRKICTLFTRYFGDLPADLGPQILSQRLAN